MHIINYDRGSEPKAKLFLGMCKFVRFMTVHSSICAWRIPWTGAWRGTVQRIAKSWTQLIDQASKQAMQCS